LNTHISLSNPFFFAFEMLYQIIPIVAFFGVQAFAHGLITKINANGKDFEGYKPEFQYRKEVPAVVGWTAPMTQDTGPIMSSAVDNPDIICHKNATPAQATAEVAAGSKIKLSWTQWPDSHKGPVMDYLADCNGDCTTVDKTQLKFFKIDAVGMTDASGVSDTLPFISVTFKIQIEARNTE